MQTSKTDGNMQEGTLALTSTTYRQKSLWLQALPAPTVGAMVESAETTFKRTLGATILSMRVDRGIGSQADLAAELSALGAAVSEAKVRRWEAGDHAPDAWEISRLCGLFGVEPVDLIQPDALTDREIQLYRRAGRQVARTIRRERAAG
jgi:ribosome-binding protein aMBF1 (putative translation factor)